MKIENDENAEAMEKFLFERNEVDDFVEEKMTFEGIKEYPGSSKGPLPEDDPEYYS